MKLKDLIEKLKEKDLDADVEFIVVKSDGEVVSASVEKQAKPMLNFLKMFGLK